MLLQTVYYLMFVLALLSAVMVVLSPHAVYAALYLILTMSSIAGLFVLMNAQLAGAFQLIVYAGAIMVLFLFVIMLLNVGRQTTPSIHIKNSRWVGLGLAVALVGQLAAAVMSGFTFGPKVYSLEQAQSVSIASVANSLITEYIYAFEMISVLLLIAVVGAVVLARRHLIQGTEEIAVGPAANNGKK